jgi:hypothetical protein
MHERHALFSKEPNMKMDTVNIEKGYPTVDQAKGQVASAIQGARRRGFKYIKIIHGYGSSGTGGAIRQALPAFLADRKAHGFIRDYAVGSDFSAQRDAGIRLANLYPELKKDSDYRNGNEGISIIVL